MAIPNFSLDCLRVCRSGGWTYFAERMVAHARSEDFLSGGGGRLGLGCSLPLDRGATAPVLSGPRLLAHQPELLSDSRRHAARNSDGRLCLVPLGCWNVGLQSADSTGPGFHARLLGPRRIRLWTCFYPTQTQRQHPDRVSRIADDLLSDADPGVRADAAEGARRRDDGLVSQSRARQLNMWRAKQTAWQTLRLRALPSGRRGPRRRRARRQRRSVRHPRFRCRRCWDWRVAPDAPPAECG